MFLLAGGGAIAACFCDTEAKEEGIIRESGG
jgi:hypothetical protein